MSDEELIQVLKEFETVQVEKLDDNARRLFCAIMKIADEREELKQENQRLINVLNELEKEINKLLQKNYHLDTIAEEYGFETYIPVINEDLEYLKNKLKKLKESDK